jgi:hypothetical protein
MYLLAVIIFSMASLVLFGSFAANYIHQNLGAYGVDILRSQGYTKASDILGTWWAGYNFMESTMLNLVFVTLFCGIGLGVFMGSFLGIALFVDSGKEMNRTFG